MFCKNCGKEICGTPKFCPECRAPVSDEIISGVAAFLRQASDALKIEDWSEADELCEQALRLNPENADAYIIKLMSSNHVKNQEDLKNCKHPFDQNVNYQNAVRFGSADVASTLGDYNNRIKARNDARNKKLDIIFLSIAVFIILFCIVASIIEFASPTDSEDITEDSAVFIADIRFPPRNADESRAIIPGKTVMPE